jgi:glycosyltransferase involved in cell wall biosynthesis
VSVIPNGCDVTEVERRAARARSVSGHGRGWRILMVSRLGRPKDHATLLRAVALMRADGHPAELSLAGDGGLREEHEALAAAVSERDGRIARLQREVADKTDRLGRLAKEMGELKAKGLGKIFR